MPASNVNNVRNNQKLFSKTLAEDFVPEAMYQDLGKDKKSREEMQIMLRQEYDCLQHFPRTRAKYFRNTMQPNRYLFREERSMTRDDPKHNNWDTLAYGPKNEHYVIDRHQSLDCKGSDGDHAILYHKRVEGQKSPPYTDFRNFSRTRQAYFNPDYIRDRAANTLKAYPHRKKIKVPTRDH